MPIGYLNFKNINNINKDIVLYVNNNKLYFRDEKIITSKNLNNYISDGLKIINGKITSTGSNLLNIPFTLPIFKININNNNFNNAILAINNLNNNFDTYIISSNIILQNITIIQPFFINTSYIINIINKTQNKYYRHNMHMHNKIQRNIIEKIIFNENDIIMIQIKNNDNNIVLHELLISLDGYYNDINNNKNEIYERLLKLEEKK
jgi:hypothetical protein